jgi:hypothetical protein
MLSDILRRGAPADRSMLFVTDGGKGQTPRTIVQALSSLPSTHEASGNM